VTSATRGLTRPPSRGLFHFRDEERTLSDGRVEVGGVTAHVAGRPERPQVWGVLKRETLIGPGQALTVHAYSGGCRRHQPTEFVPIQFLCCRWRRQEQGADDNLAALIVDEHGGHTSHVAGMV
jgi:hypothetical protein